MRYMVPSIVDWEVGRVMVVKTFEILHVLVMLVEQKRSSMVQHPIAHPRVIFSLSIHRLTHWVHARLRLRLCCPMWMRTGCPPKAISATKVQTATKVQGTTKVQTVTKANRSMTAQTATQVQRAIKVKRATNIQKGRVLLCVWSAYMNVYVCVYTCGCMHISLRIYAGMFA